MLQSEPFLIIIGSRDPCVIGETFIGIHQDSGGKLVPFRVMREATREEFLQQKRDEGRLTPEMEARANDWGYFYGVSLD